MGQEITKTTLEDEIAAANGGNILPEAPYGSAEARKVLRPKMSIVGRIAQLARQASQANRTDFGIVEKTKDWSGDGSAPVVLGRLDPEDKPAARVDGTRSKALVQAVRNGELAIKNPTEDVTVRDIDSYIKPAKAEGEDVRETVDSQSR